MKKIKRYGKKIPPGLPNPGQFFSSFFLSGQTINHTHTHTHAPRHKYYSCFSTFAASFFIFAAFLSWLVPMVSIVPPCRSSSREIM